ncbi:MAG TPA: hypothetical protein VGC14_20100, partial [Rhizobium sp.]
MSADIASPLKADSGKEMQSGVRAGVVFRIVGIVLVLCIVAATLLMLRALEERHTIKDRIRSSAVT